MATGRTLRVPFAKYMRCDGHDSRPSKMCVAYTIVAPASSHSDARNRIRSERPVVQVSMCQRACPITCSRVTRLHHACCLRSLPNTSRSTVTSSSSKTCIHQATVFYLRVNRVELETTDRMSAATG